MQLLRVSGRCSKVQEGANNHAKQQEPPHNRDLVSLCAASVRVSFNTVAGLHLLTCSSSLTPLRGVRRGAGEGGEASEPDQVSRRRKRWKNKQGNASAISQLPLAWRGGLSGNISARLV